VELLLTRGADPQATDFSGATALEEAVRNRRTAVIELLLKEAEECQSGGPARRGGLKGQADLIAVLLDQGAPVNARTKSGSTALHEAALKGHAAVVKILLERGADCRARNGSGATPLHDAALGGHAEIAALLLAKGAEINARDSESSATPLYQAAAWGRAAVVELLLGRGADAAVPDKEGVTPSEAARINGHQGIAERLRSTGAR